MQRRPGAAAALLSILIAGAAVPRAHAQAWVPGRGEGAVSIAFQTMKVERHLAAAEPVDAGDISTNVVLADVTFGLTDRLAVDVALPLVSSRYVGPFGHPNTDIDDGSARTSLTDLRFALRYNLTSDGTVVTPYVGSIVPSNSYAFYGHAAPGQQLREVQVGVYAATLLERGLPGLFISGRYGFGFVEKVLDISHNRSLADLEVGYFFTSSFRAFTMTNAGYTHGGIDFPSNGLPGLPPDLRLNHDQIQQIHFVNVGAGFAYSLNDSVDVFGSAYRQVAGRNGHSMDKAFTAGVSWGFRRGSAENTVTTTAPASDAEEATDKREGSLLRCICQKS
jgi:hypothetical protein